MIGERSLAVMYQSMLLTALCLMYCATVTSAHQPEQSVPHTTPAADHCPSPSTFTTWKNAAAQGLGAATGVGLGLQVILAMSSVALMGFSLGCMWYALSVGQKTEKTLSEITAAATALQKAVAGSNEAEHLSSILTKLNLAAKTTSAVAEVPTDAMLGDVQKGERQDQRVVTSPTKKML